MLEGLHVPEAILLCGHVIHLRVVLVDGRTGKTGRWTLRAGRLTVRATGHGLGGRREAKARVVFPNEMRQAEAAQGRLPGLPGGDLCRVVCGDGSLDFSEGFRPRQSQKDVLWREENL